MKIAEIKEHKKKYLKSVEAYDKLAACLEAVGRAADGLPGLRLVRATLKEATGALHDMGTTVAMVGEMADELVAEKKICATMRRQGKAAGIVFRYDRENEPEDVTLHAEPVAGDEIDESE